MLELDDPRTALPDQPENKTGGNDADQGHRIDEGATLSIKESVDEDEEAKAKVTASHDAMWVESANTNITDGKKETTPKPDEAWNQIKDLPKIASVRMMAFNEFKNRHGADEGRHIIEVFRAGPTSNEEINRLRRDGNRASRPLSDTESPDPNETWIQRVRIQSEPILENIQNVTNASGWDVARPWTFLRPFDCFAFFQDKLKDKLQMLERQWGNAERLYLERQESGQAAGVGTGDKKMTLLEDGDEPNDEKDQRTRDREEEGVIALRHMRCYVEFVDKEILPLWDRFTDSSQRKVRFRDLMMLFRYGDILYSPSDAGESKDPQLSSSETKSMHQTAWRLDDTTVPRMQDGDLEDLGSVSQYFEINCSYIDHDGHSYGAVKHTFTIEFFEGEKDITSLPVYPMRFAKESERIITRLEEQGHRYQSLVKERHLRYEGWTMTSSPIGTTEPEFRSREHIDSEVILDLVEGLQQYPSCMPNFIQYLPGVDNWILGEDNVEIKHWSDGTEAKLLHAMKEKLVLHDIAITRRFNVHLEKQRILSWENTKPITAVHKEDLILLPRRLMVYALRERKFIMVDIWFLESIQEQVNAFRDLKINPQHKRMIRSLVQAHFRRQDIEKSHPQIELGQDIIQGKGSGLIILLHGAPGVGKTATAQAVAQASKRPLFPITCGDLGFTPEEVERALSDITRLSHLWNCVLLLDEADIFLTRRGMNDFKKNALVSVFLRVLEYYSGILFLTTNRVGTLDEAFKSRIHVSLYYETLKRKQTLAIFQVNIARLREIESKKQEHLKGDDWQEPVLTIDDKSIMDYAGWYFDNYPEQRWNGRQIRNAFQIASSLAQYDMNKTSLDVWNEGKANEERSDRTAAYQILNWIQFDKVAGMINEFDVYLQETTGMTDVDAARIDRTRADDFEYRGTVYRPRYRPSEAGRGRPAGSSSQPGSFHHDSRSSTHRPSAQGQQQALYQIERRENLGTGRHRRQRRQYRPPQSTSATHSKQPSQAQTDFHEPDWDDEAFIDPNGPHMPDEEEYYDHPSLQEDQLDDDIEY
ncbi:hypothetical protein BDV39DRAFT_206441 [Aspergillus sergii]|uniref:AAA+ ATPase domain-containing protein n=1 Tax=Aspergillus sergii TaxID=1034303 RepID=A0A5N6X165_9EURO|nr:hypothetical protein BDV39DRAFT_206441 [Aspergillus sergii]